MTTLTQLPDQRRSPKPFVLNVRISQLQWRHLALQAERRDVTVAAVVRELLERDVDAQPAIESGEFPGDVAMSYRTLLGIVEDGHLEAIGEARAS